MELATCTNNQLQVENGKNGLLFKDECRVEIKRIFPDRTAEASTDAVKTILKEAWEKALSEYNKAYGKPEEERGSKAYK